MKNKKVEDMTDEELTRLEFSMWLQQVSRIKDDPPHKRDKALYGRWRKLSIKREAPDDSEIKMISEWSGVPVDTVTKYAKGIDPIPLDDPKGLI